MTWLPLTILACSGGAVLDDTVDDTPAPYIDPDTEVTPPTLDAGEVQAVIDETFASLWDFQPQPVLDAYEAADADSDGDCPIVYPDYDVDYGDAWYWFETCTSDAGAHYTGFVYAVSFSDWEQDGVIYDGGGMAAAGEVTDAAGRVWEGSGTVYGYEGASTDGSTFINALIMDGTWSWDGDDGGSWMSTGIEPGFTGYTWWSADLGGGAVVMDGGLFGLEGPLDTVVMDGMTLYDEVFAPSCALEPSGTISVRDTEGRWFDVTFDGGDDLEDVVTPEWCDGCGGAWFEGTYVGEVCLDFSTLLDWEERPW